MNKKAFSFFNICHQWIGLIGGWFLFVIFISGSVSIFSKEITQWMQPELALSAPTREISAQALNQAFINWAEHKDIRKNLILLPSARDPFIRVVYYQDNILQGVVIHPQQGNVIPVRATGGGEFIGSFHRHLFIGNSIGGAIVLGIGIAFIFVLISGVIIYLPTLIKKAFFIYPKPKTLRFKSDLHTIIGFFFLPFLSIMAISGVLFLAPQYLGKMQHFPHFAAQSQKKPTINTDHPNLLPMLTQAETYFKSMPSAIFFFNNEVRFYENEQARIARLKNYIAFDRQTMQVTSTAPTKTPPLSFLNKTLLGIHMVRTGDLALRSLFFLMGIGSALLVACGLLFYTTKKRNSILSNTSKFKQYFYKAIEGVNIGVIMGTLIAMIAFFWINRLLPLSLPHRMGWEISGFFISFFLVLRVSVVAAIYRKTYYAWLTLLAILSALCLFLPAVDGITSFFYLKAAITNQYYLYIVIDGIIFLLGLIFLRLYFFIQGKGVR